MEEPEILNTISKLRDLNLNTFIRMCEGDLSVLITDKSKEVTDEDLSKAFDLIISQYTKILGNKNTSLEVIERNTLINLYIKKDLLEIANKLTREEDYQNAKVILNLIGIQDVFFQSEKEKENFRQKINGLISENKFRLEIQEKKILQLTNNNTQNQKHDFDEEISAVEQYIKFNIDRDKMNAANYAYHLRRFINYLEHLSKQNKK